MAIDLNEEYLLVVEQGDTPMQIFCKGYQLGLRRATYGDTPQSEATEFDQLNAEVMSRATGTDLDIPIEELGLSTRFKNRLRSRGINIVRDLVYTPGVVIQSIDGMGERGFYEIQEKIREFMHDRLGRNVVKLSSVK